MLQKHYCAQLMQQICVNVTFAIGVNLTFTVPSVFFPIVKAFLSRILLNYIKNCSEDKYCFPLAFTDSSPLQS